MSTTMFSRWFVQHIDDFPAPTEEEAEGLDPHQVGVTLFNRAPQLSYDNDELNGWRRATELTDLIDSPHWQVPAIYVNNVLEFQDGTPGTSSETITPYWVQTGVVGNNVVRLPSDGFTLPLALAPTATPIIAMSFWYAGEMAGKTNPLILTAQFDAPILLMADAEHPAVISAPILFTWRPEA